MHPYVQQSDRLYLEVYDELQRYRALYGPLPDDLPPYHGEDEVDEPQEPWYLQDTVYLDAPEELDKRVQHVLTQLPITH